MDQQPKDPKEVSAALAGCAFGIVLNGFAIAIAVLLIGTAAALVRHLNGW